MNKETKEQREIRKRIAKQVKEAVTPAPRLTKIALAKKLDMTRQTLDTRIADATFTAEEVKILVKLKIVTEDDSN